MCNSSNTKSQRVAAFGIAYAGKASRNNRGIPNHLKMLMYAHVYLVNHILIITYTGGDDDDDGMIHDD